MSKSLIFEDANYSVPRDFTLLGAQSRNKIIARDEHAQPADAPADAEASVSALREALAARDRFLSIAAHELRNPMQPLVLQVGLLLKAARRGDMERVVEGLELLELIVARYVKRANILLDVSRLASDRAFLEPVTIDLAEWVRKIVQGFAALAEQGQCDLRLTAPESLPCCADPMAVEQILENLISNAIKFGAGKPIDVTLEERDGTIQLSVRDRGPGIAEEDQGRIFAPFETVMARAEGGGFGVGLWVVGRLVRDMNGAIELDSVLGDGATFRVILPLIRND